MFKSAAAFRTLRGAGDHCALPTTVLTLFHSDQRSREKPPMATTMPSIISAAMSPYSIADAPRLSARGAIKRRNRRGRRMVATRTGCAVKE